MNRASWYRPPTYWVFVRGLAYGCYLDRETGAMCRSTDDKELCHWRHGSWTRHVVPVPPGLLGGNGPWDSIRAKAKS